MAQKSSLSCLMRHCSYVGLVFYFFYFSFLDNCVPLPELGDIGYGWSWNPMHWPFMLLSQASNLYHGIENAPTHHVYLTELNVGGMC
jgi:hypothetical protein